MKYKWLLFFIAGITLVLFSCKENNVSSSNATNEDTVTGENTTGEKIRETIQVADSLVAGAYLGIFPCKDCQGVQQTILLDVNNTYTQEQVTWGKDAETIRSNGIWRVKDNTVELYENKHLAAVFAIAGDSLFGISIQNIPLRDSLRYLLSKKEFAGNRPVWKEKKKAGIDFAGLGNEPFWSLEIMKDKINFRLMDWKKPVTAYITEMEKNDVATIYYLVSGRDEWTVKIYPFLCSDGMSDLVYRNKVEVIYDDVIYNGCGLEL